MPPVPEAGRALALALVVMTMAVASCRGGIDDAESLHFSQVLAEHGAPDAVTYLDGKVLVPVDDTDSVDFASHRVAFDYRSANARVWFDDGTVDNVVALNRAEPVIFTPVADAPADQ